MEKNQEQLNKLARIFNSDKLVTTEDITEVLKGIKSVMDSFKKGNEELNSYTKKEVEDLYSKIQEAHEQIMSDFSGERTQVKDSLMQSFETLENVKLKAKELKGQAKELKSQAKELKDLIEEVSTKIPKDGNDGNDGKDGNDADEEKIVEEVLSKIKLSGYKETVLDDGKQIAEKLNTFEEIIDQKVIKGLEKKISDLSSNIAHNAVRKLYTGTSEARVKELIAVTPVVEQIRYMSFALNGTTALTTSDKAYHRIPVGLNGMNLISVSASVGTGAAGSSSSGIPTFTVKNVTSGNQMLSTSLTVDASEYTSADAATPAIIDTAEDDVATDDLIEVAVTTAGTGVTYAVITLGFRLP